MINLEVEPVLDNDNNEQNTPVESTAKVETIEDNTENKPIENQNEAIEEDSITSESIQKEEQKEITTEVQSPVIVVNHADIYQKKILILSDVSFTVEKGELIYIIGKTGSGKSNLLKLLYGEVPAKNGEVVVAGYNLVNIKSKNVQRLRRKLGIVFQDFQLLYDRSVYENLKFVTKVTGWKDNVKRDERIDEVLTLVGLKTKGHKMPHQLSGGEQQRVCIARALVNNPEIILADEPTGNLDPETSFEIFKLFHEISKKGTSVLIATHSNFIINELPSRVLQIEHGKVL